MRVGKFLSKEVGKNSVEYYFFNIEKKFANINIPEYYVKLINKIDASDSCWKHNIDVYDEKRGKKEMF